MNSANKRQDKNIKLAYSNEIRKVIPNQNKLKSIKNEWKEGKYFYELVVQNGSTHDKLINDLMKGYHLVKNKDHQVKDSIMNKLYNMRYKNISFLAMTNNELKNFYSESKSRNNTNQIKQIEAYWLKRNRPLYELNSNFLKRYKNISKDELKHKYATSKNGNRRSIQELWLHKNMGSLDELLNAERSLTFNELVQMHDTENNKNRVNKIKAELKRRETVYSKFSDMVELLIQLNGNTYSTEWNKIKRSLTEPEQKALHLEIERQKSSTHRNGSVPNGNETNQKALKPYLIKEIQRMNKHNQEINNKVFAESAQKVMMDPQIYENFTQPKMKPTLKRTWIQRFIMHIHKIMDKIKNIKLTIIESHINRLKEKLREAKQKMLDPIKATTARVTYKNKELKNMNFYELGKKINKEPNVPNIYKLTYEVMTFERLKNKDFNTNDLWGTMPSLSRLRNKIQVSQNGAEKTLITYKNQNNPQRNHLKMLQNKVHILKELQERLNNEIKRKRNVKRQQVPFASEVNKLVKLNNNDKVKHKISEIYSDYIQALISKNRNVALFNLKELVERVFVQYYVIKELHKHQFLEQLFDRILKSYSNKQIRELIYIVLGLASLKGVVGTNHTTRMALHAESLMKSLLNKITKGYIVTKSKRAFGLPKNRKVHRYIKPDNTKEIYYATGLSSPFRNLEYLTNILAPNKRKFIKAVQNKNGNRLKRKYPKMNTQNRVFRNLTNFAEQLKKVESQNY